MKCPLWIDGKLRKRINFDCPENNGSGINNGVEAPITSVCIKSQNWTVWRISTKCFSKIKTELWKTTTELFQKSELNCCKNQKLIMKNQNWTVKTENWTVSPMGHRSNSLWVEFKRYLLVSMGRSELCMLGQTTRDYIWPITKWLRLELLEVQMEQYSPVWEGGSSREHSLMLKVSWGIWKKDCWMWTIPFECMLIFLPTLLNSLLVSISVFVESKCRIQTQVFCFIGKIVIAFDKQCLHSAVSIKNFGLSIHGHQFGPTEKFFRGEIIQDQWRNFHRVLLCQVWPSLRA